jgi:phospholipid/cholesterol/gamma-HCH transport system substrate-binding protein
MSRRRRSPLDSAATGRRRRGFEGGILVNREVRVGVAVFLALALLSGLVFVTGGALWRERGVPLEVTFSDVKGLTTGAPVWVDGVASGRVDALDLRPEGVRARISLREGVRLPEDSRFSIEIGGLMGEPYISIRRGGSSILLSPDARVRGTVPPSFAEVMEEIRAGVAEVRTSFALLNEILGDEKTRRGIEAALRGAPGLVESGTRAFDRVSGAAGDARLLIADARLQLRSAGERLALLSRNLNGLVAENREDVRAVVARLRSVLVRMDGFLAAYDPEGVSGEELRRAVLKVGDAATQIESLARGLDAGFNGASGDNPIRDLKRVARQADGVMRTLSDLDVRGEVGIHGVSSGGGEGNRALLDASLWVGRRSSPWGLVLGADDVGDGGGGNVALGWRSEWVTLYGGIVRGDVGGGLRIDLSPARLPLRLEGKWWDEDGGRWSAEGRVGIDERWGVFYKRVQGDPEDRESIGVSYRF